MKFIVEQKGEKFLVVNDVTGVVRGHFKDKADAEAQAKSLQRTHDEGMSMATARITPAASTE